MKQLIQRRKAIEPYYSTSLGRLYCGDSLATLKSLPSESVQCCVTSPPYWGLRDYGTATWVGGDENCQHTVGGQVQDNKAPGAIVSGVRPGVDASVCKKCGAVRVDNQIGLEKTPKEYVIKMVELFRELRRVLKSNGTLWLNLGDSYVSSPAGNFGSGTKPGDGGAYRTQKPKMNYPTTFKPKDLVGVPWLVAFALRADGWYLRQDIIWAKPNPMPESITDRCTKSHEYLFLLVKSQRYYYDADSIKENNLWLHSPTTRNSRPGVDTCGGNQDNNKPIPNTDGSRNKRSVWTINTEPYPEAHFATFPLKLIEPCIRAGTKKGDTVLDPFMGSGTTGYLCEILDRKWIGIELNQTYCDLAKKRINQEALKPKLF